MTTLDELCQATAQITQQAGQLAVQKRSQLTRKLKPDGTLLTNADQEVEAYLRDKLSQLLPEANIWGEELGHAPPGRDGLWLIDPIDGTSNYTFGSPLWGVSVALYQREKIVLGAVVLPELNELYLAQEHRGAFLNGKPLPSIPPGMIRPEELVGFPERLVRRHAMHLCPGKMRFSGAFVVDGTFVAAQRFRGLIGFEAKLYDAAACICICRELGAELRFADGSPCYERNWLEDQKIPSPFIIFPAESGFVQDFSKD